MKRFTISCRMVIEYRVEIEAEEEGLAKWEAMQECRRHGEIVDHDETVIAEC
jgi:hypothetical protein